MGLDQGLLACLRGELEPPIRGVLGAFSLDYAIQVARRVAGHGSYALGFRPAGSEAARRCALYLAGEMRAIGMPSVEVLEFGLDGWEFAGARVEVGEGWAVGGGRVIEAAAYGGAFGTPPQGLEGDLVDCGSGTAADYRGVDVRGRIALVEMDLDALNWPGVALLEAAHQGAAAVVCWPRSHYAMQPGALHSHDLQVSCPIPMLNVSRDDGHRLREFGRARLFSTARPLQGATGRNIVGLVPGVSRPDEVVVIGDHYDAWFHGFMDDGVGVGAVMALARAVVESGYRPRRTLAFVLHDAEEYGQRDSPWDWCVGAHAQVSRLRPDWGRQAVASVIFELCGFREAPSLDWHLSPELAGVAEGVLAQLRTEGLYPLGRRAHRRVSTWEDAFSYAAAGIPAVANLEIPEQVRAKYYHTQFDTEAALDPGRLAVHVAGLGLLALRVAEADEVPYDLAARARDWRESLPVRAPHELFALLDRLEAGAGRTGAAGDTGSTGGAAAARAAAGIFNRALTWVGGEGMDETLYPHEQPERDLQALRTGDLSRVTGMGWGRNVSYAVYRRHLFGHLDKPGHCRQWAEGRVSPYLDVWGVTAAGPELLERAERNLEAAYTYEIEVLRQALVALGLD